MQKFHADDVSLYPDLGSASDWYIKASFPLGMTNQKALPPRGGGGGVVTWENVCWVCAAAPTPL